MSSRTLGVCADKLCNAMLLSYTLPQSVSSWTLFGMSDVYEICRVFQKSLILNLLAHLRIDRQVPKVQNRARIALFWAALFFSSANSINPHIDSVCLASTCLRSPILRDPGCLPCRQILTARPSLPNNKSTHLSRNHAPFFIDSFVCLISLTNIRGAIAIEISS